MTKQSRLEEISRKRSQRNIFIILTAIITLIVIFFLYGVPLLINFSLLVEKMRWNNDKEVVVGNSSYIAPPILDLIEEATNSAQIAVSGSALSDQVIKLYVNGKYIDQSRVNNDKSFIFKDVKLEEGENDIKAKSVVKDKESDYSQNINIVYKNKQPKLEISYPQDNQSIKNGDSQVKVEGKTDPSIRVTINDYWAIVDIRGNFSLLLRLQKGDNTIKVVASDEAGNKTEKEIKVKLE